jgi:Glycosyl hydrolase family 99
VDRRRRRFQRAEQRYLGRHQPVRQRLVAQPRSQLPAWAAKARAARRGKLYIPPVSPGCDDHLVGSTCIQDRAGGAYYQATLDGALAANSAWAIVISTYNEWMEATQIEPAVQYGDQYLDMTRAFAETFHAATPP